MALRKALSYSKKPSRPYTRISKKRGKSFIKRVPQNKIIKYQGGNIKDYEEGKHNFEVRLVSYEKIIVQVRDNALEASRMLVNKTLEKNSPGQYYMEIKAHPHHFLRENKSAAAVAGADRISTGMSQAFGSIIGRAARVHPAGEIIFISCTNDKTARLARDTLVKVKSKMPCKTKVIFTKLKD